VLWLLAPIIPVIAELSIRAARAALFAKLMAISDIATRK
jgi:hypothetical protein